MTQHNVFDISPRRPTGDILADALRTPEFVEQLVASKRGGNDLTAPGGTGDDMFNLNYGELVQTYGREVADAQVELLREKNRQSLIRNKSRTDIEHAKDAVIGGVSSITGMVVGGVASALSSAGAADEILSRDYSDVGALSVALSMVSANMTEWLDSFQSDTLLEQGKLIAVETELNEADNEDRMNREIEAGTPEWWANARRVGGDVLDAGETFFDSGSVATDKIIRGVASVVPSAKMAQVGQAIGKGIAQLTTKKAKNIKFAGALGSALGIGLSESSGTFNDTIAFVMALSEEEMMNSPEYRALRSQGAEHIDAQMSVAKSTADEAALRQLPAAAGMGLLAVRFNTNPFKIFKGKGGFSRGARDVVGQFLEEGGQGGSSELNKNIAIQNQINAEHSLTGGVGTATGEGAIVGLGMSGVLGAPRVAGKTVQTAGTAAAILARSAGNVIAGPPIDSKGVGQDAARKEQLRTNLKKGAKAVILAPVKAAQGAAAVAGVIGKVIPKQDAIDFEGVGQEAANDQKRGKGLGSKIAGAAETVVKGAKVVGSAAGSAAEAVGKILPTKDALDVGGVGEEQSKADLRATKKATRAKKRAEALEIAKRAALKVAAKVAGAKGLDVSGDGDTLTAAEQLSAKLGEVKATVRAKIMTPAMQRVEDFNERPNKKLLLESLEASGKAVESNPDNKVIGAVDDVIIDLATTQASKMTDEAILDASNKIIALHKEVNNLNAATLAHVRTMLSTPEFRKIRERFNALRKAAMETAPDLNETQTADTAVTKKSIKETVEVASLDPAKVNPDHIGKILKMEDHGLTDEQVKILQVASEIATWVNNHRGEQVEVSSRKSIALSKKPDYKGKPPEVLDIEQVSRSIQIGDFTDARGKSLRSINSFAADIIAAIQGDGTVADLNDEGTITTEGLVKSFEMFVEHMRNKVEAYNKSLANQDKNGNGINVMFRSLVGGVRMVNAGVAGGAQAVYVNTNTPKSVATAESVANDARIAAEVYNTLVRAFPKSFSGGEVTIPKYNGTPTTAAVEVGDDRASSLSEAKPETRGDDGKAATEQVDTKETKIPDTTAVEETSPEVSEQPEEALVSEMGDVSIILQLLNISHKRGETKTNPSIEDIRTSQKRLMAIYREVKANPASLAGFKNEIEGLLEWFVSPVDLADNQTRKVRALASARKHGNGNAKANLIVQLIEELNEVLTEQLRVTGETIEIDMEVQKRALKVLRFGGDTIVKQDGIYKGMTNAEALALAKENTTEGDETISPQAQIDEEAETAPSDQNSQEVTKIQNEDDAGFDEKKKGPVTEKFAETFEVTGEDVGYESGADILNLLNAGTNTNSAYRGFARQMFETLIEGMNDRLDAVPIGSTNKKTPKEVIMAGGTVSHIRDFKNTMLVDAKTGKYDPDMLSIAVVAMIDWMSSVRSADPHSKQLKKTLNLLGVDLQDLNDADMHNILHGVSPRFVAETMSRRIVKMWNLKVNPKGQMVDARGAAEGIVKELIEVITDKFDLITVHDIPTKYRQKIKGKMEVVTTPTINVKGLKKIQKEMGLLGRDSVLRLLTPEEDTGPSIGVRISTVDKKNRRGTVDLSKKERRALRNQQDVPHKLANGISQLIGVLGFDVYGKMQGYQADLSYLSENHPLRNSINGKNLSIERDWDDAHSVTAELQGDKQDTEVFFRVTVTKAGRHQHSGINTQNNTTLRVMVSAANALLDMTKKDDIDGFWLTVAQASGLFKVENVLHDKILAEIQGKFAEEFGEAQKIIEQYLDTGKIDGDALFDATGEISMEQLNSIYAVADLKYQSRSTNALTSFHTTLGFELDGKTDGPAHMMNNFGQGLLTVADYLNFKRVGMFLGTVSETLNSFFADEKMKDLYNAASVRGMTMMYSDMAHAGPAVKEALYASARFAERFGDFEIGPDGLPEMTRNTIKNPMTKTVYGSGLNSVARGIAEDTIMGFYKKAVLMPKGADPSTYFAYPSFESDFEMLFGVPYPTGVDWSKSMIDKQSRIHYTELLVEGIGAMIANSSKEVIGKPVTRVADLLVFITNVQTEFQKMMYRKKLVELTELRAKEGAIGRSRLGKDPKDGSANTGKGIQRQLSVEDFKALEKAVAVYGPSYDNGVQILNVGAFSPQQSNMELSNSMGGKLNMKSTMNQPEDARVKVIPYLTQGRGDAMVVNTIFGEPGAPEDMVAVHDGFYVPINKIKEYSRLVNGAVMQVWDRDVLGDTVTEFQRFLDLVDVDERGLLHAAMKTVKDKPYDTTVKAKTTTQLMQTLKMYHRGNQVRKIVNKKIPMGVDHLGGAQEAAIRNAHKPEMDRHEMNELIADEMGIRRVNRAESNNEEAPNLAEEARLLDDRAKAAAGMRTSMNEAAEKDNTEIVIPEAEKDDPDGDFIVTDTNALLGDLLRKSNRLAIRETVKVLSQLMRNKNFKVVIAKDRKVLLDKYILDSGYKLSSHHQESLAKRSIKGWVNVDTQTMYLTSANHETLVHEMMHVATYQAIVAHYNGSKTNSAIPRLEALMEEFMKTDYSDSTPAIKRAVNAARATILHYQTKDSAANKSAAISEFMSWTLSSAPLVKDLKTRDTALVKLIKTAKILIKRILGRSIPDNMYTHILFNTLMLDNVWAEKQLIGEQITSELVEEGKPPVQETAATITDEFSNALVSTGLVSPEQLAADKAVMERRNKSANRPTTKETPGQTASEIDPEIKIEDILDTTDAGVPAVGDGGDIGGVGNDNNSDGNDGGRGNDDGGVTPQAVQKTNFWIDLMRQKLADIKGLDAGDVNRAKRVTQFRRYRNAAAKAMTKLDFGGFVMNEYEKNTFRSIHLVLATEMRLNAQSGEALNKMFEHITTNLKPSMFGKGRNAQELYATVMDLLGDTKNDEGVTDAMAVLLALSQTSKAFRAALDEVPDPTNVQTADGSLNGFLTSITGIMMQKALGTINIADSGAKELLDVLADNLIREDTEREYTLLRTFMGSLDKADKFMGGAMNELAERAASVNTRMSKEDRNLLTKLVTSTFAMSTAFFSAGRSAALAKGAKRITHMGVALDHAVFLREFVTEVVGQDATNAEVMMMLDRTSYGVQAIRQEFKEKLPVIMQNAFTNHPDEVQWKATHRVLASLDFAHLFDISNPERAFNLIKDASLLSSKTVEAEAVIVAHFDKDVSDNILDKAKQLAGYMNRRGAGHQLLHNAHVINKLAGKYDESMTGAIDTLTSLYALEIADQAQKDIVVKMYEDDPQAVQNLVTYIQALNLEEDIKVVSEGARMQGRKGWVPDHPKKNAQIVIQRDDLGDEMIKMGYIRVGDVTADNDFSSIKRGYYATTVKQGTTYSQGVLQSVQGTYRGVNAVTGIAVTADVNGVITGSALAVITSHLNKTGKVSDDKEVLSPVHDEDGLIWAYERMISPDMIEKYAQPKSNLALMLGAWAGRQVEEKLASQYNFELITELKRIYDNRESSDDKLFIDVSDPKLKDPVYRESWRVISPDTRQQIAAIFGPGEGFMVQKSMMNLALGYSDPTVLDIWTGKTRMPKGMREVVQAGAKAVMGDKAVTILSRGEEGIQGTVAKAKDIIVVRSLIVPYMNTQANVMQLQVRGIGLKTMKDGYVNKMVEIERFNENSNRLMEIRAEIALHSRDKNRVRILEGQAQVIRDENLRMSIAPLIEAGQYKNISEGITDLDVELTTGRMAEWVENQVNKLPSKLQTITKYGLLSKDTVIYKMANKAVQYGDFLAKSIYYDHLRDVEGVSHEDALRKVNEEFVNFSILPGRTRSYLESMGGTWFMSFKIRIMKVALNQMRENPVRALILMASGIGEFGSPVNDNLGTVIFQERFGYSVGWTMLLGSPELNPWAQLWGWA